MKKNIRNGVATGLVSMMLWGGAPSTALAQDGFLGEMRFFAGNFAPRGWAKCDGQLLAISRNKPLFSILGTIYGGDGRTTFALPDMRGRVPLHAGRGPGLREVGLGEKAGGHAAAPLSSESGRDVSAVAMTCIIAVYGHYPSRS